MTDISKCGGEKCPVKGDCYRYTAPSEEWQSFMVAMWDDTKQTCEYFWRVV